MFDQYQQARLEVERLQRIVKRNNRRASKLLPVPTAWQDFDAYVEARNKAWAIYCASKRRLSEPR